MYDNYSANWNVQIKLLLCLSAKTVVDPGVGQGHMHVKIYINSNDHYIKNSNTITHIHRLKVKLHPQT